MKKHRIFPDVTSVSRGARTRLRHCGVLNKEGAVYNWASLSPYLSGRKLSTHQAKQLILIELEADEPRRDTLNRLMNYIGKMATEGAWAKVEKELL